MSDPTKPITLITATPGGGKSALAVQRMMKAHKNGRPLFVGGIPELKLDHSPLPPISDWTEMRPDPDNPDLMLPYFTFPPNSLIVIDEAQRIFRPRASGSKVPDHVAAFETVRHTGVTFLLMTQNPTFIDAHIRKLVGEHVHLRDVGLLGRWYYEWPECANPENFATAPIKKKWSLPKETFGFYKSSSMHIKRSYSVPPALLALVACVLGGGYLVYSTFATIKEKTEPAKPYTSDAGQGAKPAPVLTHPLQLANDPSAYLASFSPVIPGRPESAPIYAMVRTVKDMPRVVGGMCTQTKCVCITQQGTNAGLDDFQCREWLKNPPFDPYRDPAPLAVPAPPVSPVDAEPTPKGERIRG